MNTLTLESLLLLFAQSNERLLYYKKSHEDEEMTKLYKRTVLQIQNAIIIKRAEQPPLK